jgi:hypothetical protein
VDPRDRQNAPRGTLARLAQYDGPGQPSSSGPRETPTPAGDPAGAALLGSYTRGRAVQPRRPAAERFSAEVSYDAAFAYWNLRGVLAERWGHGPIFAAMGEAANQVNLTPVTEPGDADNRIQVVYGLKGSGLLAEGPERTAQAREVADHWFPDVYEVLAPRKTVRMNVQLFGLYPITNAEQVSRRLRGHFYRNEHLLAALPDRLREHQDSLHGAINWISIGDQDGTKRLTSLIAGIVGPVHAGAFFTFANAERDQGWWMGINVTLSRIGEEGIRPEVESLRELIADASADYDAIAPAVLREVIQ